MPKVTTLSAPVALACVLGRAMVCSTVPYVAGAVEISSRNMGMVPAAAAPLVCGPPRCTTMLPGVKGAPRAPRGSASASSSPASAGRILRVMCFCQAAVRPR